MAPSSSSGSATTPRTSTGSRRPWDSLPVRLTAGWPPLPGGDQPAVDSEVGPGDVGGAVAGQHQHQVGDLLRAAEPPGDCGARRLAGYVPGLGAGRLAHRLRDPVLTQPQIGGHRAGADRVDPDATGPYLLGQGLAEPGQGGL